MAYAATISRQLELAGLRIVDRQIAVADIEIGAQESELAGRHAAANVRKREQIAERGNDRSALEPPEITGIADFAGARRCRRPRAQ
jgi:hypothetical protein